MNDTDPGEVWKKKQQSEFRVGMASSSYTPISGSTAGPSDMSYISRAKQRVYSAVGGRRPWRQVLEYRSLSVPRSISECLTRIGANLGYFRVNMAMVVLFVLFLALLWHPVSLIVMVVMMAAWLFLFFLRDQPLQLFRRTIDDRIILALLSILTLLFLFLTSATLNIIVALAVSLALVFLFSVFRRTDDHFVDEDTAAAGGLVARSTAA